MPTNPAALRVTLLPPGASTATLNQPQVSGAPTTSKAAGKRTLSGLPTGTQTISGTQTTSGTLTASGTQTTSGTQTGTVRTGEIHPTNGTVTTMFQPSDYLFNDVLCSVVTPKTAL